MRRSESWKTERRRRWGPLALTAAALLAVGLAASWVRHGGGFALGGGLDLGIDLGRPSPPPAAPGPGDPRPAGDEAMGEFGFWTVVVLGAALAAPVIVMLVRMLLRTGEESPAPAVPPLPDGPEETVRQMREALRAGLADLDSEDDPRRAVIACWLRLERAAARAGTPREAADTPADLVSRLLSAHRVGAAALERLAAAYRRARYSPHEVDGSLRETARRALAEVDAELGP
ncbi:hypothetical protein GCM10010156_73300 [Planobispora rosea]|uniref:Protein-glutamine gamma-glutamyltransferase-like C-terminal domain-containing protein n=1 Tax=Planobispora rosea TaxID=35762 RepID=A0A8J3WHP4_PLARO|nr:DUF4129 domain-containing protein [Planobispora rosea]GGT04869.1 hypothetical protein GCM10010156_73300 [Planobispora rosea]GIH88922.1 hypothetical protein Pro02_73300 [Planobispora rosea]